MQFKCLIEVRLKRLQCPSTDMCALICHASNSTEIVWKLYFGDDLLPSVLEQTVKQHLGISGIGRTEFPSHFPAFYPNPSEEMIKLHVQQSHDWFFFKNVLSKICVAGGEGGKGGEGSTITAVCEHRHLPRSDDQVWLLDITDCRWPTKQQRNEKSIWECSFHSGFRPAPARPCPSVSFCTLLHQKQTPPPWRTMRSHTHPSGNTTAGALCH